MSEYTKKHCNIPVFIPHLGCPNECVFCNQRSVTGRIKEPDVYEVREIIDGYLPYIKEKSTEIAFFGGSFTGLSIEKQSVYLEVACEYIKKGRVSGIRVSTRPDFISEEILNNLKKYGITSIEIGVQSMDDGVLLASKRGHMAQDAEKAAVLIKSRGFALGLQMMTGLPGDTKERSVYTAKKIVEMKADFARVYPTCVFYGTELFDMYKRGEYVPQTIEEAIDTAKEAVAVLEAGGVPVIRIGLQEADTLVGSIAAGAYHPAIGELIRARIARDEMEEHILSLKPKPQNVTFFARNNRVSQMTGQKRKNIDYLENKYGIKIKIVPLD